MGKNKPAKKVNASGRGSTTPSSSSAQSKVPVTNSHSVTISSCSGCGIIITDDTKALQCDCCQGSSTWKCINCLSIEHAGHNLKWFCDQYESVVINKASSSEGQNRKLDQLITVIEKLMEKFDGVEHSLATKCDSELVGKMETRIQVIEEKLSRIESNLDHRAQYRDTAIEDRLSLLESRLTSTSIAVDNSNDHGIADEVLIKCAVQEEVKRITDEDKDHEARKNNIVIFRIPEKKIDDVKQRKDSDITFVKDLLDCVFDMKLVDDDVTQIYRLGHWDESKPRPLLVSFRSLDQKEKIMSNLRNLKQPVEKFQGISNFKYLSRFTPQRKAGAREICGGSQTGAC